jgi:hypothetical protein
MTRDEILNMPAGEELDELIAQKLLPEWVGHAHYGRWIPSINMYDAWQVIEAVQHIDSHWSPGVNWDDDDGEGNPMWIASFQYYGETETEYRCEEVWDKSAPLAICRAALLATLEAAK